MNPGALHRLSPQIAAATLALVASLPAGAADLPTWADFEKLLGQPISTPEVKEFVATYRLQKTHKGHSGSFDNFKEMPFSLLFGRERIARVLFRVANAPGENHPLFTGELPYKAQIGDTLKTVMQRMGKPDHPIGTGDFLFYKNHRVTFDFFPNQVLYEIALDAPEPWEWPSDPTFARYAAQLDGSPYTATLTKLNRSNDDATIEIKNAEGKTLHHWRGHQLTSFLVQDHRLFYAEYHYISPGIVMHSVDLDTGRELWKRLLPQDGPAFNSKYSNLVNVAWSDDHLLIFSKQSWAGGKFSWSLSPKTGEISP